MAESIISRKNILRRGEGRCLIGRPWLDAVQTPIAVQQKMMRHTDIRTTMNIYGDVVTDEMTTASSKVAQLAFPLNGAQAEREDSLAIEGIGGCGRNRTYNLSVKSRMLCQLSYAP
jgi:hypothetical protein